MKFASFALIALLVSVSGTGAAVERIESGNRVGENLPEIPAALME
jgi:hypothetical protein